MSFFDSLRNLVKKQDDNKDTDDKQFTKLSSLFVKNPKKAIDSASKYLIKSKKKVSYEQFIDEIKSTQRTNFCSFSWNKPKLCAQCFDCQKLGLSCFCIPCFLSGHHEQHNSVLFSCDSGCCDCGNPSFITPSGFCSNHPGPDPNPDITQMTPENRIKFITVFKAAYYGAMNSKSEENMIECIEYISQFITYGDGLRRCAAYAIVAQSKEYLYKNIMKMTVDMIQALIDLFGQLMSDFYFHQEMSFLYYKNFNYVSQTVSKYLIDKNYNSDYEKIKLFDSISFHYFSMNPVTYSIRKENFNWPDFLINIIDVSFDTLIKTKYEFEQNSEANTIYRVLFASYFIEMVKTIDDQHEKIQEFIDKYSLLLAKYEGILPFYVRTIPEDDSDEGYNTDDMMSVFGKLNSNFLITSQNTSPKNKQFSITGVVSSLFQYYKKKNISAQSVLDSKKKTLISTNLPLHNLLFCLLQSYDDIKSLVESECQKNQIDFQQFCSLVSICPLRALASYFASGKFCKLNAATLYYLKRFKKEPLITFNCLFGLVQILLGIAPDKEQIFGNILTTFGCFDDLDEFKKTLNETDFQRQVSLSHDVEFDAGVFIMSLLTDHSVLSLDKTYFNTLRVVELLKKSRATAKEIQDYIDEKLIDHNFSEILLDYIERVKSQKGVSYFTLKEDGDFTPYFPLIHVNDRMNLFMKYKDKLIPVPDCDELPRGISLKSCFRSPSFVALTFKLLSLNNLTQVGISMLINLVKNGEKFSPESFKIPNPIQIKATNLRSLISELEKCQYDSEKVNILTINVQFQEQEPTTLMKLVVSNKQLGTLAVEKAELPVETAPENDKFSDLIREKKAKAALFKQRMMKEYQNRRKQFGTIESKASEPQQPAKQESQKDDDDDDNKGNDNDDDDDALNNDSDHDLENSDIVCSFCLSNQEDIFGYPCLSLPTTLPSIIENKLHNNDISLTNKSDTYSMNICSHPVHFKCYKELQKDGLNKMSVADIMSSLTPIYQCSIDRGSRNCFLPLFQSVSEDQDAFKVKPSISMQEAINDFIKQAFYNRAERDINVPISSFAGIILKLEVRHRKRPESLDAPNLQILLRNLFLTLYHGLHEKIMKTELSKKIKNPLIRFVYSIIKSEDPIKDYQKCVQFAATDLEGVFMYEFLRRCAIIEDFALKNIVSKGSFIDWDDVLSFDNLLLRFHVAVEYDTNIELPLFETINLPEKFISLCMPPFKFDLIDSSSLSAVDLLTGKVCMIPSENHPTVQNGIDQYCKSVYNGGLGMFLVLTGRDSSNVLFYASNIKKKWQQDGFYTDKFGDIDPGFERGVITTLSKDRLENSLDSYLSGDVVLY